MQNWFEFYDWVTGPDGPVDGKGNRPTREIIDNDEVLDFFIEKCQRDAEKLRREANSTNKK